MFSKFIQRPVLAISLSLAVVFLGVLAIETRPVSQFPDITPPRVNIFIAYPGASAQVLVESTLIPLERAIMAIRFNQYFIGSQFHPEADAIGMSMYLQRDDKKQTVIDNHGEAKWKSMIEQLNDPRKIMYTHDHILPNFLNIAMGELVGNLVER